MMESPDVSNLTNPEYIVYLLGPPQVSNATVLTSIYVVIFFLGVISNCMTCLVICKLRSMHTKTNYYLFNLSMSDLCVLLFLLPLDVQYFWRRYPAPFGEAVCIGKSLLSEACICSSVLTVTAFSVERYIAICHPMKSSASGSPNTTFRVIALIWILSFVYAAPMSMQTGIRVETRNDSETGYQPVPLSDSALCTLVSEREIPKSLLFSSIVLFVIPMAIITVLYIRIGLAVRDSSSRRRDYNAKKMKAKRSVLNMLVSVVVGFFICYAPFHAERIMVNVIPGDSWTSSLMRDHDILFLISGLFFYTNAIVNPLLYNIMSAKFRRAFRHVALCQAPNHQCGRNFGGRTVSRDSTNVVTMMRTASPAMRRRVTRDSVPPPQRLLTVNGHHPVVTTHVVHTSSL